MTIEEVEKKLREAKGDPAKLFGKDVAASIKQFRIACHPDLFPSDIPRKEKAAFLFSQILQLSEQIHKHVSIIKSPKRSYALSRLIATGDVADVYFANDGDKEYVVKISRVPEGSKLLENERIALEKIAKTIQSEFKKDSLYHRYFPQLVESFPIRDGFQKRVNVFHHEAGFYTLEQAREKYPRGLDGKHIAWVFKRLLVGMGVVHKAGIVHGSILPCHIQIHAENHGLQLIGWGQSVKINEKVTSGPANYLSWFPNEVKKKQGATPSTDIFLAASSMVYLAGGNPSVSDTSPMLPPATARFVRSCLMEGKGMRPNNAWDLHDEFNDVLQNLYGPPKYHKLSME